MKTPIQQIVKSAWKILMAHLNTVLLRLQLRLCGINVLVFSTVRLQYPKNIFLGNKVRINPNCELTSENSKSTLIIENGTELGNHVHLDFSGNIEIGIKVVISDFAQIHTHDHGLDPFSKPKLIPLIIGDNVWIGTHAIILPNVKSIGNNAVIGAGAVVTKSVKENTVVAGNPAKVIKIRKL